MKKRHFLSYRKRRHDAQSHDHMPTTSLWGVAAKWPTHALKTKLTLCLRDPQGYSHISLSLSGRILKEYRNIMSALKQNPMQYSMVFAKSLTEVLATQMGMMRHSKKAHLNCINLIHFHLTAGRLHGSLCIVIPEVICELLQFVATQ